MIGLDEIQNIISDAFIHDSFLSQKIMDKMTNACFQDHASTRLSRRIKEPPEPPQMLIEEPLQELVSQESKLPNPEDERIFLTELSCQNSIENCRKPKWIVCFEIKMVGKQLRLPT